MASIRIATRLILMIIVIECFVPIFTIKYSAQPPSYYTNWWLGGTHRIGPVKNLIVTFMYMGSWLRGA